MSKYVKYAIFMLFLATPFESLEIFPDFSIVKLISIILIMLAFFARRNIFAIHDPFFILLLVYTTFTIFSFFWSIDPADSFKNSMTTILPNFLISLIIFHYINDRQDLQNILKAYIIGSLIIAVLALYVYRAGSMPAEDDEGRVTVLNQDQNELSFLLSFGIVSITYMLKYLRQTRISRIVLLFGAFLLAFVILTTGSRMGLILLFMIAGTLAIMNFRSAMGVYLIPLFIISGILFFQLLPDTTAERLLQTGDQIHSKDLTGRVLIWRTGLIAFESENAYILGTGFDTAHSLIASKTGWGPTMHNTYLSTFIELGSFGLLIFLSLIIYLLNRSWYLIRNCSLFFALMLLPLLAAMSVLSTSNRRWLFLIGVIIIRLWYLAREENNAELPLQNIDGISET